MSDISVLPHSLTPNPGKPVVVYLHGFLGGLADWNETVTSVGDLFSHLQIDLPGHTDSSVRIPDRYYSMSGTAELVINVLDHMGIDRCHLVGYSMGGRLGLYLLVHYPDRFLKAIIESASPGLKTEEERSARRASDRRLIRELQTKPRDEFLTGWYAQPLFQSMNHQDARFAAMLSRRLELDAAGLSLSLRNMGTGAQPSLWENLSQIGVPTLFLAGELDRKFSALAKEMAGLCPHGRSAIIPGAGHSVHYERPAEFSERMIRFLSQEE
jgi:2-succinyl-6-hydroxy-2,4-cyclohexadiene-1-carboxylate synthase